MIRIFNMQATKQILDGYKIQLPIRATEKPKPTRFRVIASYFTDAREASVFRATAALSKKCNGCPGRSDLAGDVENIKARRCLR